MGSEVYSKATVKNLERYLKLGFNVYLTGPHGIGKTSMVAQACNNLGWKCKVFNTALLDPFVDITGIPQIENIPLLDQDGNVVTHPETQEEMTRSVMKMIRSADLDDADVIMFDEFKRGRTDVVNAIMNIVDQRMINNEKLPNLKAVVAASNPEKDTMTGTSYSSSFVDEAIIDRFDVFLSCDVNVNSSYISSAFKKYRDIRGYGYTDESLDELAQAISDWQHQLVFVDSANRERSDYVSPRRCEKLGKHFMDIPKKSTVKDTLGKDNVTITVLTNNMYNALFYSDEDAKEYSEEDIQEFGEMWYEDLEQGNDNCDRIVVDILNIVQSGESNEPDRVMPAFVRVCELSHENGTKVDRDLYKQLLQNGEPSLVKIAPLIIEASAEVSRMNEM